VSRPAAGAEAITAAVWDGECRVVVANAESNAWFSRFLGRSVRLVYQPDDAVLPMGPQYAGVLTEPRRIALTDGAPLLLIGDASLDDLNRRLAKPLLMNRFRPNLVVSGFEAYAEDTWKRISIGAMRFEIVRPCPRCVATTVDQISAERGDEPLRTLATYRKVGSNVMFGQSATHHAPGRIRVGDNVDVLS
jgi:MOSC domain-containing protein